MEIIAHRGDHLIFPENTLEAFESALIKEVDGIELDVHLTKDQQLVVIHDETIDRTSNGTGAIKEMTLEELRQYNYQGSTTQGNFVIPTLEDVLNLLEKYQFGGSLNVEAKTDKYDYPHLPEILVAQLIAKKRPYSIIISGFNFKTLKEIHDLAPHFEYAYLMGNNSDKVKKALETPFIDTIHPKITWVKKNQVELFHFPKKVRPWTINTLKDIRLCQRLALTGVITDEILLVKKVKKEE